MHPSIKKLPIKAKLVLLILMSCVVALVLEGLGFMIYERVRVKQEMVRDLTSLARIIADRNTASLTFNDDKVALETLSALKVKRSVTAAYIGKSWRFGEFRIPIRQLVAFAVALGLTVLLAVYLSKTFMGRAIRAVAQDEEALRLMGANPVRIKQFAFGIATAVLGIAGALLIIVAPIEPTLDRAYIGRTFCVVVMAGLGSISGTLIAAIILGVSETIVLTMFGASWAPAISFGMLLAVLAVRPQGLLGR